MFGSNPDSVSIKQVYFADYQYARYTRTVFRAFAEEKLRGDLMEGDTIHWPYRSNFLVNDLGGNGSYSTQALTDTDQTMVVSFKKEVSFQIPKWYELQFHLPVIRDYGRDGINAMYRDLDADLLGQMQSGAANSLDASYFGGSAGTPITPSIGNILQLFGTATEVLQSNNIQYVPKGALPDMAMKMRDLVPVAAISPRVYNVISQFVAGKNSSKGDDVMLSAYLGYFMQFNLYVTNNLPWETRLFLGTQPTDGDTVTIAGLVFTFKTVLGVAVGNVLIGATAVTAIANLVALLNAPYTTTAQGVGFVQGSLTYAQQYVLSNNGGSTPHLTATQTLSTGVASASGTYLNVYVIGQSVVTVSVSMTAVANAIVFQQQHCIFGTSKSIAYVAQRTPNMEIKDVSGQVARDFVSWNLYARKVFHYQTFQLIDARLDTTTQIVPQIAFN